MSGDNVTSLFPKQRPRRGRRGAIPGQDPAPRTPATPAVHKAKPAGAEQLARQFYAWCETNRDEYDPRSARLLREFLETQGAGSLFTDVNAALGTILTGQQELASAGGY
ncbi:MAG: hypothetical protein GC129_00330 [Proteobacteria bacterium]|nr:hypothetical protein [Pseudomonadota bacterium]